MLNMSNDELSYLGHKFVPKNIMSPSVSIKHVLDKTGRAAGQLRSCGKIGRRLLCQLLLAPINGYAAYGLSQVKVSDLASIQALLDKACNSKFKANSKILPSDSGGFGLENVFNR